MNAEPTAPVAGPTGVGPPSAAQSANTTSSDANRAAIAQALAAGDPVPASGASETAHARKRVAVEQPNSDGSFSVAGVIPQLDIYAKLDADDLRELIRKKDKHIDQLGAAIVAQGKKIDKLTKVV